MSSNSRPRSFHIVITFIISFSFTLFDLRFLPSTLEFEAVHYNEAYSFFAVWLSMYESPRMTSCLSYIRTAKFPTGFQFRYIIVNYTRKNESYRNFWFPPSEYRALILANPRARHHCDSDLAAKFFFGLRFFLLNSNIAWFWRGTDDSIINFAKLPKFVRYLNHLYDPYTQPIILGNCIHSMRVNFSGFEGFLQGGSGWVISRRAAELIEPLGREWVPSVHTADDIMFNKLLQKLNISLFNATSEFFLGHDIRNWPGVTKTQLLVSCEKVMNLSSRICRRFTAPLQDIVFWHEQGGALDSIDKTLKNSRVAFNAHRKVHFWMSRSDTRLCVSESQSPEPFALQ
jgi:hypothetical protein